MKTKEIREKLDGVVDTLGKNKAGNYVVRRGFFYRHGTTAETFAADVKAALPSIVVIDRWEHWAAFRGGASTAQGSHFGVEFKMAE